MYEASTERLGEVATFFLQVWLPTQSYKEHKNKKQKKHMTMIHSRKENKSPEIKPKETRVIRITWQGVQIKWHKDAQWAYENDA